MHSFPVEILKSDFVDRSVVSIATVVLVNAIIFFRRFRVTDDIYFWSVQCHAEQLDLHCSVLYSEQV